VPIYYFGDNNDDKLRSTLERFTLLNVIGKPEKLWLVFGVTIVIATSGHLFIYFFGQSVKSKTQQFAQKTRLRVNDTTVSNHTLMFTGLNKLLSPKETLELLETLLK
jgi:hypothetical protein